MRGHYTFQHGDEKIELYFGTWTMMKFAKDNGNLSLSQVYELIASGQLTIEQIMSLILCAAEYKFQKEGKQFPYTLMSVGDWVDGLGGLGGAAFSELIGTIAEGMVDTGQKKSTKAAKK